MRLPRRRGQLSFALASAALTAVLALAPVERVASSAPRVPGRGAAAQLAPPGGERPAPRGQAGIVPEVTAALKARLRAVFLAGQAAGNQPGVIAKIGDSITESGSFLVDVGCGAENLGSHPELVPTIAFFRSTTLPGNLPGGGGAWCGVHNSFSRASVSATAGWIAGQALEPHAKPVPGCPALFDTPLQCELHLIRPSIAVIMYGTNDLQAYNDLSVYRGSLTEIVTRTLAAGVIPLLSTIPPRLDAAELSGRVAGHNQVVREVAQAEQVPLLDYWQALQAPTMVNQGIDKDGIHPNVYACDQGCLAADFTVEGLRYGYNQRNLRVLQALAKLKAVVIDDGPPDPGGPTASPTRTPSTGTPSPTSVPSGTPTGTVGPAATATPSPNPALGIHVASSGVDSASCGAAATPCRTIAHGISRVAAGQTVFVHAGLYQENFIAMRSNTTVVSADGPLAARIHAGPWSGVRFVGVTNVTFDGFEVYADWNQGEAGDGLVRVLDATNITIRNSMLHDAAFDSDVVKVSGAVSGLVLENLVIFNPGQRVPGSPAGCKDVWYQENIDIYGSGAKPGAPPPAQDIVVRGSWLFHTPARGGDWLLYSKINAQHVLYENNIFGPSAGLGCGNPAVGIGTGEAGEPDPAAYVVQRAIVRNNIFVGLQGDAAFAIHNAHEVWVYNNTFYGNSGPNLRSVIELRGNTRALGAVHIFNNLFQANQPTLGGGTFYRLRDQLPAPFFHDANLYVGNVATSDVPYVGEPNSIYGQDAELLAPSVPSTASPDLGQIGSLLAAFALRASSPAVDRALDAVARDGHPNWKPGVTDRRWDARGQPRPVGGAWDLGALEVGAPGPSPGLTATPSTTRTPTPSRTATSAATSPTLIVTAIPIRIEEFAFHPPTLAVPVGATVRWANFDPAAHTATSDKGLWSSGLLAQGESFTLSFNEPGIYGYFCEPHPGMRGTIIVGDVATPTPTPTRGLGGRDLTLAVSGAASALSWTGGDSQTQYVVVRWAPIAGPTFAVVLPASAVSHVDTTPMPEEVYCYVVVALGPPEQVGISDLLCRLPRTAAGAVPQAVAIRLSQSNQANLSWVPPPSAPTFAEVVAFTFDGAPPRTLAVPPGRFSVVDDTGGATTCYVLRALAGDALILVGNADVVCASPGVSNLSTMVR